MPELPSVTVTEEQQQRILEAYMAYFGTTDVQTTVNAYKKMIADMVRDRVVAHENKKLADSIKEQQQAVAVEVSDFMDGVQ
jgi:hypothetical protein